MVTVHLECEAPSFEREFSHEYGSHNYQEDVPECKLWFDQKHSNELTSKAKSWLLQNGYPETKAGLCSAKAPIQDSRPIPKEISEAFPFPRNSFGVEEQPEAKEVCMSFCDYCPSDTDLNQTIETNTRPPRAETTETEEENKGTIEFSLSLDYLAIDI